MFEDDEAVEDGEHGRGYGEEINRHDLVGVVCAVYGYAELRVNRGLVRIPSYRRFQGMQGGISTSHCLRLLPSSCA